MAKLIEKRAQPEPPPIIGYTLEMTPDEVDVLKAVFSHVLTHSRRYPTAFNKAARTLRDTLGYVPFNKDKRVSLVAGGIRVNDRSNNS